MRMAMQVTLFCLVYQIAGCETNCVNDNGPYAGQCRNYPDKNSCSQVSPYHHSCTP